MKINTINYETLKENITTSAEAFKLAAVTFEPSVIIERVDGLMSMFAENYLDTEEDRKKLIYDLEHRPGIVSALFFSIFTQLKEAEGMLLECQSYTVDKYATKPKKVPISA